MARRYFLFRLGTTGNRVPLSGLRSELSPARSLVVASMPEAGEISSLLPRLPEGVFLLGELEPSLMKPRRLVQAAVTAGLFVLGACVWLLPGVRQDVRAFLALLVLTPALGLLNIYQALGVSTLALVWGIRMMPAGNA